MSGKATLATARLRLATAATSISEMRTRPARFGAVEGSPACGGGARSKRATSRESDQTRLGGSSPRWDDARSARLPIAAGPVGGRSSSAPALGEPPLNDERQRAGNEQHGD